jgi:hypothetical protein
MDGSPQLPPNYFLPPGQSVRRRTQGKGRRSATRDWLSFCPIRCASDRAFAGSNVRHHNRVFQARCTCILRNLGSLPHPWADCTSPTSQMHQFGPKRAGAPTDRIGPPTVATEMVLSRPKHAIRSFNPRERFSHEHRHLHRRPDRRRRFYLELFRAALKHQEG